MKLRTLILLTVLTLALSACNLTLAEDVTPPPGYIPPTPVPTFAPTYPEQTPNLVNGAAIFIEKCAPCHGETGLGDGKQGLQLPVTVRPFGLPEVARPASPEQYYAVVTRGNIERFMPPFASLTDQERWDVTAYVLTLHTTPEQVAYGRELFETNCADCSTAYFEDLTQMAKLSEVQLARLIRDGNENVPAFASNLTDAELWAVAAYLRTLAFDASPRAQAVPAPASQTPVAADAGSASAEATPVENESAPAGSAAEGYGSVSGTVENSSGAALPSDLVITLHGFDHASGANAGAQEVLTQEGEVNRDGSYVFENIELPRGRIFIVEAAYSGITLQSELGVVAEGQTSLTMPPLALYEITVDNSGLVIDALDIIIHPKDEASYEVYGVYSFRNPGETVVAVRMADQREIPFLKFPEGAQGLGYEAMSDSAPLISLDNGFALAPNERPYGIIAYSSFPKQGKTTLTQTVTLSAAFIRILVPDGMEVSGAGLTAGGAQTIQGTTYQMYTAADLQANDSLTFEISGAPKSAESGGLSAITSNNTLLLGAGAGLGLALILAGVWMYVRDRKQTDDELEEEEDEDEEAEAEGEFSSSEEVLDAILTLDDLHRAKKISDAAYQKRRAELKEMLKGML